MNCKKVFPDWSARRKLSVRCARASSTAPDIKRLVPYTVSRAMRWAGPSRRLARARPSAKSAAASSSAWPRSVPFWSRWVRARTPMASVSDDSGTASSSARTRCQWRLISPRSRAPTHSAARRVEPRLVEERPAHQLRDRRRQLRLGKGYHPVEDRTRDVLADHGGGPEDVLLARGQPVDAPREDRLHGRREGELGHRADHPIRPLRAGEAPGLHQRLHDLLDEERVPAGVRADAITEPLERRVGAEPVG